MIPMSLTDWTYCFPVLYCTATMTWFLDITIITYFCVFSGELVLNHSLIYAIIVS